MVARLMSDINEHLGALIHDVGAGHDAKVPASAAAIGRAAQKIQKLYEKKNKGNDHG